MKTMVIKTSGECEEHDHAFDLDEMQAACGGWMDSIRLTDGMRMWVNDTGLIVEGFEPNILATMITVAGGYRPEYIVMGDVVLVRDDEDEFPEEVVDVIKYVKNQFNAKIERTN